MLGKPHLKVCPLQATGPFLSPPRLDRLVAGIVAIHSSVSPPSPSSKCSDTRETIDLMPSDPKSDRCASELASGPIVKLVTAPNIALTWVQIRTSPFLYKVKPPVNTILIEGGLQVRSASETDQDTPGLSIAEATPRLAPFRTDIIPVPHMKSVRRSRPRHGLRSMFRRMYKRGLHLQRLINCNHLGLPPL